MGKRMCLCCGCEFEASEEKYCCEDCTPRDRIHWVSVEDKLPRNDSGSKLVTILHHGENEQFSYATVETAVKHSGLWEINTGDFSYEIYDNGNSIDDDKVIAWAVLPEPYQG